MYEEEHSCKFRRVSVKHNSRPLRRMSGAMMDDIIDQNAHVNHREARAHPLCVSKSGIIAPGSGSLDSAPASLFQRHSKPQRKLSRTVIL